jgi:para-nitrobenzyl esterase
MKPRGSREQRATRARNRRVHTLLALLLLCACSAADDVPAPTTASSTSGSGGVGGGGSEPGGGGSGGDGGSGGSAPECTVPDPEPGLVVTDTGAVRGMVDGNTWSFRGIPYAAPPIDDLRFRPPEAHACWSGERMATAFGSKCLQKQGNGFEGSEDCLTLNVWTPLDAPASPRAVMFFIHGGGNQGGTSSIGGDDDPLYDGVPYVEQADVVVVTVNYRLGALGFIAHPALSAESARGASGNYGLLDQIEALQWVHDNIAAFGGDPDRVMVFGESAGAIDSCMLFASPLAAGLVDRVLMESGACVALPLASQEAKGATFASGLGCGPTDAACLRALAAGDIIAAQSGIELSMLGLENLQFNPTVDGWVLPDTPLALVTAGLHNDVPFVVGSNSDEMSPGIPLVVTANSYHQAVYDYFGMTAGDQVIAMYDPAVYGTPRKALIALATDVNFGCPARRIARAAAGSQTSPVYRYLFSHGLDGGIAAPLGAFHALELYFVFQQPKVEIYDMSANELALSHEMLGYWSRFAVTADPNDIAAAPWPAYAPGGDAHIVLDTPISAGDGIRTAECDLLDSVMP